MTILQDIREKTLQGRKTFSVLLDPDKYPGASVLPVLGMCEEAGVDLLMVGGSLLLFPNLDFFVKLVKSHTTLPVLLFPGDLTQISVDADGILFLSLISGRNPELLIGRHVQAAPLLRNSKLEIIPAGYMLIGNSVTTAAQYISNTFPIPDGKEDLAVCTAMAGEMLGLQLIYLDAGSGSPHPVPQSMVSRVKEQIDIPLIVGGGIRDPETAYRLANAGADMIVAGNAFENDPELIGSFARNLKRF